MSGSNSKNNKYLPQDHPYFPEESEENSGTKSHYDFAEFSRRRAEKLKDQKVKENRRRKFKQRAA